MPVTQGQGNPDWTRDETILALDLVQRHWPRIPGKRSPEVKALSDLIRRLPIHPAAEKNEKFRNPDGVYLKLQNLASLHPEKANRKGLRTSITDRATWSAYGGDPTTVRVLAEQITKGILILEAEPPEGLDDDDSFQASEGAVLARVHRIRERKRGFRSRVIRRVERERGTVCCEACGVTLSNSDSALAHAVFEVHHLAPLCEVATTVTRLQDLALLCANCHRLIHAVMRSHKQHYSLEQFVRWSTGNTAATLTSPRTSPAPPA